MMLSQNALLTEAGEIHMKHEILKKQHRLPTVIWVYFDKNLHWEEIIAKIWEEGGREEGGKEEGGKGEGGGRGREKKLGGRRGKKGKSR